MTHWWHTRAWRLIQTNLREIDMLDIKAEQVVADLQAFKANVLLINAAGIIASYPTKLPFHFQSPYLKGDSLQMIIGACHQANIRVFARTDFSKVRRPIYELHPEWASLTVEGQIVDYNGDVQVCINGAYQQHYMPQIIEEVLSTHDFDGIFFNMGGYQVRDYSGTYYGPCYCDNCRQKFAAMFDLPLPRVEDPNDPIYRKYQLFKKRTVLDHRAKVAKFIRSIRPELCMDKDFFHRQGFIRQESNTAIARPLPHWQYSASDNTKWAVTSYPDMVSSNSSVDFIDFPYRHGAVSPAQQALRLAQNLANGGALDYYLIGRLDNHEDRSGFEPVKTIFHYHAANEAAYAHLRSKAKIVLLKGENEAEFRGWFRFLVENHFLFDTLIVDEALNVSWDRYESLILPDIQAISDGLAERIDRFVSEGGTLIAVSQSGFRDELDEPRSVPALKSVGLEQVMRIRSDMRSSYFKLSDKSEFQRFEATDLIYMDGAYVYAVYETDVETRLELVPPHHFGPPERCYYTQVTAHPGLTQRRYGQGTAIYIPWQPGQLFHRQGYLNTSDFIVDVLVGSAGLQPLGGNLSPMVEVTWFEKEDQSAQLLHLVNSSGHFGVSFFEPVPMTDLTVELPYERQPAAVQSLVHKQPCDFTWANGTLTLKISKLGLFDAVRIT